MLFIQFPEKFTPGLTDNFVSNEVIVKDISFNKVLDGLLDAAKWETYYENSSDVYMYNQDNTVLTTATRFRFKTFGFDVEAEVEEYNLDDNTLRLAWHGWNEAEGDEFLDVYHAWLVQKLDNNRVRILTQESQIGAPAKELAKSVPNTMLLGHQAWLDGLISYAK
ncbi:poly(A) polymerase [Streptococcus henryi]|uniref:Poly(A) polymerase n=1 Tax=Streptococcus henryi TaxID=439219 RepID=A0A1G6AH50_9STRE|nr:polyketide cyclase [Streptococcus henryi]SDB07650.1 poly(A) polymerase [Streptococcus henryi]